ncbi:hypothetical protein QCA50_015400 [Cerrena zonata]|uniref:Uncharacterized protein n=1 Tax=Cerrena zonata TaxID=2478898 RepID=A0AAW0FLZ1_9APHY
MKTTLFAAILVLSLSTVFVFASPVSIGRRVYSREPQESVPATTMVLDALTPADLQKMASGKQKLDKLLRLHSFILSQSGSVAPTATTPVLPTATQGLYTALDKPTRDFSDDSGAYDISFYSRIVNDNAYGEFHFTAPSSPSPTLTMPFPSPTSSSPSPTLSYSSSPSPTLSLFSSPGLTLSYPSSTASRQAYPGEFRIL